jgi:TolB-like protein/Tfp pilus assembly protein PilF/predicted Ser/Thr protein kinase
MTGQTVSHYRILDKLGEGGMGVVYKAEDLNLKRTVALKFLHAGEDTARLLREAQAAASLMHPNICTVFEVDSGHGFLAMEFVEGPTLGDKIRDRPLRLETALRLACEIASGIKAAHDKGVVHRDIKSANILLTLGDEAKVTDFGLATLGGRTRVTTTGVAMGTPGYMAPEQARGEKVDRRADVWALGVVLYEMVAGKLPFHGDSEAAVVHSILNAEPEPLTALRVGLPVDLDRIVAKCLAKDPGERYQHVEDLLVDLRALRKRLETGTRTTAELAQQKARNVRWWILRAALPLALVLVLAVAAAVYWPRVAARRFESLAVLPFVNAAGGANLEYLSDGIPEALTNILSREPGLRVTPRSRAFMHRGAQADPVKAGSELGVQAVLTGRVAVRGESLNIQVELIDVSRESQLWGEQFSRPITEIAAVQDEIARIALAKLNFETGVRGVSGSSSAPAVNSEAYQRFLRGRFYWDKRTVPMLRMAVSEFRQALDIDPNYAREYAGLAEAYAIFAVYNVSSPAEAAPLAKAAITEALSRDDSIAEAHTARAFVSMTYDFDLPAAEKSFRRALELNPQHPTAHFWYGLYNTVRLRHDRAIEHYRLAQQSAPLSPNVGSYLGWGLLFAGRTGEAIAQLRRTLEIDPNFPNAHLFLGMCYQQQGHHAEAVEEMKKARELSGDNLLMIGALGHGLALAGRQAEALKVLAELTAMSKQRYVSALDIAHIHLGLKDKDKTFEWLEKAYQERSAWIMWINPDPRFDWLRSDPRFTNLLRRLNAAT